ncbi:unnamed protein product [Staurois parvus]|uniref:Uncharacterized protein n=1 Tax=Staurois parvus TaxID=386267 RepID=A0ABN9BSF6_9NEOB|nr:unnamed protein product [Staurois parvus]
MYVKWFDTVMFYYVIIVFKKISFFFIFKFAAVLSSQGPEHRSQMPAPAGGGGRGRCRGRIMGAKDKVSAAVNP